MSVILSMKTFRQLEEKLGTDAAKEVYELAEAVYEEVNKKLIDTLNKQKLEVTDEVKERVTKNDLMVFKKEIGVIMGNNKDDLVNHVKFNTRETQRKIKLVTNLLIVNLLILAGFIIYYCSPLFNVK